MIFVSLGPFYSIDAIYISTHAFEIMSQSQLPIIMHPKYDLKNITNK